MVELRGPSVGILDLSHGGEGGDHRSKERLELVGLRFGALGGEEDEFSLRGEEGSDDLGLRTIESKEMVRWNGEKEGRGRRRRTEGSEREGRRRGRGADLIVYDSSDGFRLGEVGFEMLIVPVVKGLDGWGILYWC